MRMFGVPLLVLVVSVLVVAQTDSHTVSAVPVGDLYIPAVLSKSVRSEEVHAGDKVCLDVLESVLVGYGLVLPHGAHLYGHVVYSEPLEPSAASRLSLEVDGARWRNKTLALHAFVSGLGRTREVVEGPPDPECDSLDGPPSPGGEDGIRPSGDPDPNFDDIDICTFYQRPRKVMDVGPRLKKVSLEFDSSEGSTAFVSRKKNVDLPGGLLVMLHNVPPESAREVAGQ